MNLHKSIIDLRHIKCIHTSCEFIAKYAGLTLSKLLYEWLNEHMLKEHHISLWRYLDNNSSCKHKNTINQERSLSVNHIAEEISKETICLDCGEILKQDINWY